MNLAFLFLLNFNKLEYFWCRESVSVRIWQKNYQKYQMVKIIAIHFKMDRWSTECNEIFQIMSRITLKKVHD